MPKDNQDTYSVYHLFVIRLKEQRNRVLDFLQSHGVGAGVHYPIPLPLQPAYKMPGYEKGNLPNTELAAEQVVSLPIYPELTETNQQYVIRTLLTVLVSVYKITIYRLGKLFRTLHLRYEANERA